MHGLHLYIASTMQVIYLFLLFLRLNDSVLLVSGFAGTISSQSSILRGRKVIHTTVVGLATTTATTSSDNVAAREAEANQFQMDLENGALLHCLGIFHAVGCRNMADVQRLTASQLAEMGVDDEVFSSSNLQGAAFTSNTNKLHTNVNGAFTNEIAQDFQFEAICETNGIWKGRLFTPEQSSELVRLSEFSAYKVNPNWHGMACKSISGFISTTDHIFDRLLNHESGLNSIYSDMTKGSLRLESDSEPHLVKYSGKRLEAPLHKDNTHKSLTLNALLSNNDDFGGGGTYIRVIDKVIKLEQGEMLIHPGNLDHAGAEITFGVRRLLVAFLECEWYEQ